MDFDKIVHERIDSILSTLTQKAKEYAKGGDHFHTFNVAARMWETTPEKALYGMMSKHMVSVLDLVNAVPDTEITEAIINEKIGDNINYLILLEGLLKKRVYNQAFHSDV